MGDVIELVQTSASEDTVEMLGAAYAAADRGEPIGAVLILLYRGRHYSVDAAGLARLDPTWARGTLRKLDDELAKLPEPTKR